MEKTIIDISASPDMVADITKLTQEHGVRISKFTTDSLGSPVSNFPTLDPTYVTAAQQATVILGTGAAAVQFVRALIDLIRAAKGKVGAVDRGTGAKLEAAEPEG